MATKTDEVLRELTVRCERLRQEAGVRLPSERELAEGLNASRSTVRRALNVLTQNGVITIERGRNGGAYLTDGEHGRAAREQASQTMGALAIISANGRNIHRGLEKMADIPQMLIEQESDVDNRVLSLTLEASEAHVASLLDIETNEPVVCLLRLRLADGAPLSLERMYLSFARFPHLLDEGLGGGGSMYALLKESYGVTVASAEEQIEVAAASPEAANLLAIKPGDAVLTIQRRACDPEGRPVECSFDIFRGDRTSLTVRTLGKMSQKSIMRQEQGHAWQSVRGISDPA
jgi:GntR family transcriptional regulator